MERVSSGGIDTIWVVPISHLDIGFTAAQDEVFRQYKEYIDQVLAYLDEDPDFSYTIETVWQYLAWERQTSDPAAPGRLWEHVRRGRLGIGAAFATMHTGMLGMEEMHRVFYAGANLARERGFELTTAWMNDVPGYNWALPRTLAAAGIRYFVTGLNLSLGGGADIPPASIPFYWQGADGSSVLTWASTRNYLEAWEKYRLHEEDDQAMAAGIQKILGEWLEAGYPYDSVLAIASAGDNLGPGLARRIVHRARRWNAERRGVRIVVGTAEQFFWHMERKYAGRFPVISGDWNGLWEFARGGNARGTGIGRRVRFLLPGVEAHAAFKSVTGGETYPKEALSRALELLLTYDEHSAGNGTGWPKLLTREQVIRHNQITYGYALDCDDALESAARAVMEPAPGRGPEIRGPGAPAGAGRIVAANPLSWRRDGEVEVAVGGPDRAVALVDLESGERIPGEVAGGSLRFWAKGVPPLGWRTYAVEPGGGEGGAAQGAAAAATGGGRAGDEAGTKAEIEGGVVLENEWYRVAVSPQGEVESIFDKRAGRECFDRGAGYGWNALVRSRRLDSPEPVPLGRGGEAVIRRFSRLGAEGVRIERRGPCPLTEIVLPGGHPAVEFHHTFDMAALESDPSHKAGAWYYLIFPIAVDPGAFDFQYDTAAGMISPQRHTMKGAPRGAWPVQSAISFEEPGGFAVAVANRQSFLWCKVPFGRLSSEPAPANPVVASVLFSLNDLGESKDQGLISYSLEEREPAGTPLCTFSYALTSWTDGAEPVRTLRFGYEWNAPLLSGSLRQSEAAAEPPAAPAGSVLAVDAPNVFVTAVKLPEDAPEGLIGEIVVRLQEVAGRDTDVTLDLGGLKVESAALCDLLERPYRYGRGFLPVDPVRLSLGPREVATLRLRLAGPQGAAAGGWWNRRRRLQP